jgi:hypothetical protein
MGLAVRNHWHRNWLKGLASAVWNHGYNWIDSNETNEWDVRAERRSSNFG